MSRRLHLEHDILTMGPYRLFTELGIHKGLLGTETRTVGGRSGLSTKVVNFTYYHLGLSDVVGVEDGQYRRVFPRHVTLLPLGRLKEGECSYLGPAQCSLSTARVAEQLKESARLALVLLNGGAAAGKKPKIGLSACTAERAPRIRIKSKMVAKDAPDVGKTLPFRIKGRW